MQAFCRHCPVVPVYNGVFRIVDREVVLADIRQQVAAGAQHITFGDPDFFNGSGARDADRRGVTSRISGTDLRRDDQGRASAETCGLACRLLRETGCLFCVSAVESLDDAVLERLDKSHTREDFLRGVELCRRAGLTIQPTFVPFTPWTTLENYWIYWSSCARLGLAEAVAPIQLAIRLLIPSGSRLLEIGRGARDGGVRCGGAQLPVEKREPGVDRLCEELQELVAAAKNGREPRGDV